MEPSHSSAGRRAGRVALLIAVALLALPISAQASSVTPTSAAGNPSCGDLDAGWSELKIDSLPQNQTYSNSDIEVTISNLTGNETFDWSANHNVDAVIVKASTGSLVYTYDPESKGDTAVSGPAGHDISHVSFCYDDGDPPPPPPPTCAEQNAGAADSDGDGIVDPCDDTPNPPAPPAGDTPPAGQVVAPTQAEEVQPGQIVLGERVGAVRARLLAPTGCTSRAFTARVRGVGIQSVVFRLDGKRLKTLRKGSLFSARVNPVNLRLGVHRLVATVKFQANRRAKARTLRASFQRCGKALVAPRFTG